MSRTHLSIARLLVCAAFCAAGPAAAAPDPYDARVARVLKATPLIDGHNDWAEAMRERVGDARWTLDLTKGLEAKPVPYNTDIARLRKGWSAGNSGRCSCRLVCPAPSK